MNQLNNFQDASFEEHESTEDKKEINKIEKILCNHCGRTRSNGIRCLGICVADNDY